MPYLASIGTSKPAGSSDSAYTVLLFLRVRPKCATKAIRVYCDMGTGTMIHVQPKNELPRSDGRPPGLLASAREVRQACASLGLEPLVPRGISHIHSAMQAVKQMGEGLV